MSSVHTPVTKLYAALMVVNTMWSLMGVSREGRIGDELWNFTLIALVLNAIVGVLVVMMMKLVTALGLELVTLSDVAGALYLVSGVPVVAWGCVILSSASSTDMPYLYHASVAHVVMYGLRAVYGAVLVLSSSCC